MKTNSEINFFSITFGDWNPPKSILVFEILILISFLDEISPIKTGLEPTTYFLVYSVEIFNTYLFHPVATSHRGYQAIANDWARDFPTARSSGWLSRRVAWKSGFGVNLLTFMERWDSSFGIFTYLPSTHKRLLVISFTAFTVGRSCTSPL